MPFIRIKVDGNQEVSVNTGSTLEDVAKIIAGGKHRSIMAAFVDNKMRELNSPAEHESDVRLVDLQTLDGIRVYQRSASFILIKAVHDLYPEAKVKVLHPISNGLYVEIADAPEISPTVIKAIEQRMKEVVAADFRFTREELPIDRAISIFEDSGREDKVRLLKFRNADKASVYHLDGQVNYFYGYLAPATGYIQRFALVPYDRGMLLQLPSITHPDKVIPGKKSKKLYDVFKETLRWREILEVEDLGMLNEVIKSGQQNEFVLISEAFHEKKIAQIADMIAKKKETKVVLISGPSASGKTTFTKRLGVQLRINGLKPLLVSMDDYFLDRDKTPRDHKGNHDFESPYAINVELFQKQLQQIVSGQEVTLPRYNFKTGMSEVSDVTIKPDEKSIILIEGIHGMNPIFSSELPKKSVFKIYVSALTEVPLDSHNRIPTTDIRILRRMIRDFQFRGYSATQTIHRWPSVREGESRHVFPFQEEADIFFNTALVYEIAALKTVAEPLLAEVQQDSVAYAEALRLQKFLSYVQAIPVDVVPRHSILREFVGGSSFKY